MAFNSENRIAVLCKKGERVKYKVESAKRDMSLSAFFSYCVELDLIENGVVNDRKEVK